MSSDNNDMRTPLAKVRGLGSAREGTEHFWRQRLTAISNIPLILFFVGFLIALNGAGYTEVRAALANPFVALIALNTFFSVAVGVASIFALLKLAFGG